MIKICEINSSGICFFYLNAYFFCVINIFWTPWKRMDLRFTLLPTQIVTKKSLEFCCVHGIVRKTIDYDFVFKSIWFVVVKIFHDHCDCAIPIKRHCA